MQRLLLLALLVAVIIGGGLYTWTAFKRAESEAAAAAVAAAMALEAEKQAEAQKRVQGEVEHLVKVLHKVLQPVPAGQPTLPELVHMFRKNAESMDQIDTSGCPVDVQKAFQKADQAEVDFANYLERATLRRDDSPAKTFLPLLAGLLVETVALPIIAEKTLEAADKAKQKKQAQAMQYQEEDAEAVRQFKLAFAQFYRVVQRYGYVPSQNKPSPPKQ